MTSPFESTVAQSNALQHARVDGWAGLLGRRRPGWEPELRAWAAQRWGASFAWGEADCALLAFEAIDLQLGTALAERHRGRYASLLAAVRYQAEHALDLVSELVAAGCRRLHAGAAGVGDVLLVESGPFLCGHVCFGARCLSANLDSGVRWSRTRDVLADFALSADA